MISRSAAALRSCQVVAAILVVASVVAPAAAQPEPAQADAVAERERVARARYDEAVAAYRAGNYQQAIALFLAADQLAPSAALSFNVARAYERLDDSAGALKFYRDYLRREVSPVNMAGVRTRIAELESDLAARGVQQLTVLSEPSGAFVSIDGEPRGPTPWTGELAPGNHELTLLKEGYPVAKRGIVLEAAHAAEVSVSLARSEESSAPATSAAAPPTASAGQEPSPTVVGDAPAKHRFGPLPWITLGVGGAALLAAGGFELARAGAEDDARDAKTQIDYVDRYEAAHSNQTAARILLGVGGAFVVAGGVLVVLDLTSGKSAPAAAVARCTSERCIASFEGAW
jgi:tetratricopeptide (TPR) repeat protein